MGSQMKEMSKRGEKEKTNKEELGLYEIMNLRNAHHFSNPKLKEMQHLLAHQLLLVAEEVRGTSPLTEAPHLLQRKPRFLWLSALFESSSLWVAKTNFLIMMGL